MKWICQHCGSANSQGRMACPKCKRTLRGYFKGKQPMALLPHQQRVIDEREALNVKIEKLEAFTRSEQFQKLYLPERTLLREQLYFMQRYSATLAARIALFKES